MPKPFRLLGLLLLLPALALAQEQKGPPVKVNILNVCSPAAEDQKEIAAALARIPAQPKFGSDFEVSRGHSTPPEGVASNWVRIRHDFVAESPFSTAQYQFSVDAKRIREGVVLQRRELKEATQVSFENEVTDGSTPAAVLASDTPVARIRVERFGKSSLTLVRCPAVDQSAYEPLFHAASGLLTQYRAALNARSIVPGELQELSPGEGRRPPRVKPMSKRP